jgi:hypothetical protein
MTGLEPGHRSQNGGEKNYFQPDSLSQAAIAAGFFLSHAVIESVSPSSIFSFMQMQYLRTTFCEAPPRLLSATHLLIQARSSAVIACAKAAGAFMRKAAATAAAKSFDFTEEPLKTEIRNGFGSRIVP